MHSPCWSPRALAVWRRASPAVVPSTPKPLETTAFWNVGLVSIMHGRLKNGIEKVAQILVIFRSSFLTVGFPTCYTIFSQDQPFLTQASYLLKSALRKTVKRVYAGAMNT